MNTSASPRATAPYLTMLYRRSGLDAMPRALATAAVKPWLLFALSTGSHMRTRVASVWVDTCTRRGATGTPGSEGRTQVPAPRAAPNSTPLYQAPAPRAPASILDTMRGEKP